ADARGLRSRTHRLAQYRARRPDATLPAGPRSRSCGTGLSRARLLERPRELEKSVGLRKVAAKRHPWRDRSKDHGETQEARQGCRQTRAPAEVCNESKAGREAEGDKDGREDAEAGP